MSVPSSGGRRRSKLEATGFRSVEHCRYDKAAQGTMGDAAIPSISGRRLLLTGGAGFIGSHIAERLAAQNQIVILDTLRRNALAPVGLDHHPNVKVIVGDVTDAAAVRAAMEGVTPSCISPPSPAWTRSSRTRSSPCGCRCWGR
jgi:hypothetical protein